MVLVEDLRYLTELAEAVIEAARVRPGEYVGKFGPNLTGHTLIRPGGGAGYPAFWIRDFAMSQGCGLIRQDEQLHALLLTAKHQSDHDWHTPSGSFVPKGAIPDHISFDGKPIFFPGTIDDYEGQGGKKWGYLPSLDDHFYFTEMAWQLVDQKHDITVLKTEVAGISLLDRLEMAFNVPPVEKEGIMVCCGEANRGVSFGFTDAIEHTGELLFCSLLRCRAALQLADLFRLDGNWEKYEKYSDLASLITENIPRFFTHEYGLLKASTGKSAQPDVWGSAFAVYYGLLNPQSADSLCRTLARAVEQDTISWKGNIRHVPTDADFNSTTAWESALPKKNTYQNGAYWGTPVGWVAYAVARVNEELASGLLKEYFQELREGDYRQGPDFGSPWECMHSDGNYRQNPIYMTSVTEPLAVLQRVGKIRGLSE